MASRVKDSNTGLPITQLRAVDNYTNNAVIKADCKYTWIMALREAGYSAKYITNHAGKIWQKESIQRIINDAKQRIATKTRLTVQEVLSNIQWGIDAAKAKNDISALASLTMQQGKYLAMFTDNLSTNDITKQKELESIEKIEAQRLANIMLINNTDNEAKIA